MSMSQLPRSLVRPAIFDAAQLGQLGNQLGKIYNKKIEFNIINLKYAHLNSDILAESIATQLRDRKSSALRVMKSATVMARLPVVNRLQKSRGPEQSFTQQFSLLGLDENGRVAVPSPQPPTGPESLNDGARQLSRTPGSASNRQAQHTNPLEQSVLQNLKHKTIAGVRIRAAGRLSKRLTANRAVQKIKQIGQYSKLPANTVLGYRKANLQYSMRHSKTRNGAFGIRVFLGSR